MTKSRMLLGIILLGLLFAWGYKHSPRKIEFLGHYEKIGVHRTNTLEKLENSLPYFDAIELDIVYDAQSNFLDVYHPPALSNGVSLEKYVYFLKKERPFLWLDIKNLDSNNAEKILQNLNTIIAQSNYPTNKILIETRFPEKLGLFAAAGYKTSYYLKQNLHTLNPTVLHSEIENVQALLKAQPGLAISTEHFDYEILKEYFPTTPKYFWCIRHSQIGEYTMVRRMLKDTTVALVLTRYSPF